MQTFKTAEYYAEVKGQPGNGNVSIRVSNPARITANSAFLVTGTILTATPGTDYSFTSGAWRRNGVALVGQTALTYTLTSADYGSSIDFQPTGSDYIAPAVYIPPAVVVPVAQYLGVVANGTQIPDAKHASNNFSYNRTPVLLCENVIGIIIALWGKYMNGGTETNNTGIETWTGSIEYPVGVYTQLRWGGNTQGTLNPGAKLLCDMASVSIPKGAKAWVRLWCQTTGQITFFSWYAGDGTAQGAYGTSVGAVPDLTMGGNAATTPNTAGFMRTPHMVLGLTTKRSVLILGDSISVCRGYVNQDGVPLQGDVDRVFGGEYGTAHGGQSGDSLANFVASHAWRVDMAQYVTDIVLNMGINDVTGGASAATIQANTNTSLGYFPGKHIAVNTLSPVTTSTDNWATVANQTVAANEAVRVAVNTQRKTNLPLATVVWDINQNGVENIPSPEDGKWAADAGLLVVGGADGTHPNTLGYNRRALAMSIASLMVV